MATKCHIKPKNIVPSSSNSLLFALAYNDQDTDTKHKNQGHIKETHKKSSAQREASHDLEGRSRRHPNIELLKSFSQNQSRTASNTTYKQILGVTIKISATENTGEDTLQIWTVLQVIQQHVTSLYVNFYKEIA